MAIEEIKYDHLIVDLDTCGFINVDQAAMTAALQPLIARGSMSECLTLHDLTLQVDAKDKARSYGIMDLINGGTKVFDAIIAMSLEKRMRPEARVNEKPVAPDLSTMLRYLFALYFHLINQATVPDKESKFGKFVTTVMGIKTDGATICAGLASFDLNKMNHTWIKGIKIRGLDSKVVNRFALGVAGYRLPAAVVYGDQSDRPYILDLVEAGSMVMSDQELKDGINKAGAAAKLIKDWLDTGLHWYCHPVTRAPEFITKLKSLNKTCSDLLCFYYSKASLEQMKKSKVIFEMPTADPSFRQWKNYSETTFAFEDETIFEQ